ncbi:hypothetical protein TVAG_337590 [Trichomonas vaginalis G3]|uniref:DUF3447 domain-containing protein n=1 Tax=Trichomonas vaginalis (strain ATCC PRA-98 / G3) TaxID=412133 RepID=A2EWK5_TRIV3|nr:histone-lysine N-methyltransferase family [Trichomonas vaginalis G3]EAY02959.1 hypothetical protein TVAG_337590 [Trichomonas vaginalis G3]KAI5492200.1 histone-lysine N-methyltransferase family [Trichomonas vaginalis G3]|eukprot:XP_001315182.1 hypothetical protein [Trichomonas vaginalis G3]
MKLTSVFYPKRYNQYILSEYSLIELCCYHGSVRCFKYLLSEFKSEITHFSLELSFLSGKPDIINECLKYQEPNYESMKYAIISHNIDFVCFLMNEYHLSIIDDLCLKFNNIQAFLILLDQTNEFSKCFLTMLNFRLKPLVKYFIQHGVKVNAIPRDKTTLKIAIKINCYDLFKYHVLNGACINGEYKNGRSPLHIAAKCNSIKILQSLISLGANINSKDDNGKTALHYAVIHNCKEAVELLISLDANIHLKDKDRKPAIHYAKGNNEIVKLLRSHKNDRYGLRHLSFCNIF